MSNYEADEAAAWRREAADNYTGPERPDPSEYDDRPVRMYTPGKTGYVPLHASVPGTEGNNMVPDPRKVEVVAVVSDDGELVEYSFTLTAVFSGVSQDDAWAQWTEWLTDPSNIEDGTTIERMS